MNSRYANPFDLPSWLCAILTSFISPHCNWICNVQYSKSYHHLEMVHYLGGSSSLTVRDWKAFLILPFDLSEDRFPTFLVIFLMVECGSISEKISTFYLKAFLCSKPTFQSNAQWIRTTFGQYLPSYKMLPKVNKSKETVVKNQQQGKPLVFERLIQNFLTQIICMRLNFLI